MDKIFMVVDLFIETALMLAMIPLCALDEFLFD